MSSELALALEWERTRCQHGRQARYATNERDKALMRIEEAGERNEFDRLAQRIREEFAAAPE